jgi:hypothetical protein
LGVSSPVVLPRSEEQLNVEALAQIFNETTNSYKILFFRAVLSIIGRGQLNAEKNIPLSDITAKMLVSAWIASRYYRLSLGSSDKLSFLLSDLSLDPVANNFTVPRFEILLENQIKGSLESIKTAEIQRYVPYRLIRPFFSEEIRGLPDSRVNQKIREYAEASFSTERPAPYIIVDNGEPSIKLNPRWHTYFERNVKILTNWADWHLASYLQRRNPNSPAITSKLYLPKRRGALLWQRRLWEPVFLKSQVRCIYSNKVLARDTFHLDHYLPWSFVCHDEPWNLIPVLPAVNSSKGAALPSSQYLSAFIDLQTHALSVAKAHLDIADWERVCSSYVAGLRIDSSELGHREQLHRSFKETILPLASIAKRMGFVSDWAFTTS